MFANGSSRTCVRFVSRTKTLLLFGSIQQLVPVKPVCPKLFAGKDGPAVDRCVSASCQAIDRASFRPAVKFVLNSLQVSGAKSFDSLARNCEAICAVSAAVEKRPA